MLPSWRHQNTNSEVGAAQLKMTGGQWTYSQYCCHNLQQGHKLPAQTQLPAQLVRVRTWATHSDSPPESVELLGDLKIKMLGPGAGTPKAGPSYSSTVRNCTPLLQPSETPSLPPASAARKGGLPERDDL
jgi:hypothetical protein